jgi:phenylacetate-CoA ligase
MSKLSNFVYNNSPVSIQNMLVSMQGKRLCRERFGSYYASLMKLWEVTQWLSFSELLELQGEKLRALIQHAYETVPYYKRVMSEAGLKPDDIKSVPDLEKFPILTKDDIRKNFKDLISTAAKDDMAEGHSSGTTGSPINVLWDKNVITAHNAAIWRHRSWVGFEFGRPYASILGRVIVPISQKKPPFWRFNKAWNQLFLSSFHLESKNFPYYFEALSRHGIESIQAYPSTIFILASYLEQEGKYFPLKYIFTSSEPLLEIQREVIEERFKCKIYDCYGLAERVMYSGECAEHNGHHLYMEYGITEIVDNDALVLPAGKFGRVIATGLHNYGMPLIRYEVGDVSAYRTDLCTCKRGLPLLEAITTKAEDIVVTPDGRYISSSILTHPFKPMVNIEKSQIIQEAPDRITIKIVKRPKYTDKDSKILLDEFYARLGDGIKIELDFVDDIPRSGSGKYRWVISKVPLKYKSKALENLYD